MVDKGVDLEELSGDHGVGLTGGQHPVHIGVGDAQRQRLRPLHLGQRQVTAGSELPRRCDRLRGSPEESPGQVTVSVQ